MKCISNFRCWDIFACALKTLVLVYMFSLFSSFVFSPFVCGSSRVAFLFSCFVFWCVSVWLRFSWKNKGKSTRIQPTVFAFFFRLWKHESACVRFSSNSPIAMTGVICSSSTRWHSTGQTTQQDGQNSAVLTFVCLFLFAFDHALICCCCVLSFIFYFFTKQKLISITIQYNTHFNPPRSTVFLFTTIIKRGWGGDEVVKVTPKANFTIVRLFAVCVSVTRKLRRRKRMLTI